MSFHGALFSSDKISSGTGEASLVTGLSSALPFNRSTALVLVLRAIWQKNHLGSSSGEIKAGILALKI